MLSLCCRDQGFDCEFRAEGATPDETLSAFLAHAIRTHADELGELRKTMTEEEIRSFILRHLTGANGASSAS